MRRDHGRVPGERGARVAVVWFRRELRLPDNPAGAASLRWSAWLAAEDLSSMPTNELLSRRHGPSPGSPNPPTGEVDEGSGPLAPHVTRDEHVEARTFAFLKTQRPSVEGLVMQKAESQAVRHLVGTPMRMPLDVRSLDAK